VSPFLTPVQKVAGPPLNSLEKEAEQKGDHDAMPTYSPPGPQRRMHTSVVDSPEAGAS